MSGCKKRSVWVNRNNLGRYWEIGPQRSLYCPASFLKNGQKEIAGFDLHQAEAVDIKGITGLK